MIKTFYLLLMLSASLGVMADDPCTWKEQNPMPNPQAGLTAEELGKRLANWKMMAAEYENECAKIQQNAEKSKADAAQSAAIQGRENQTLSDSGQCKQLFDELSNPSAPQAAERKQRAMYQQCGVLRSLSRQEDGNKEITMYQKSAVKKFSTDRKITCDRPFSYTVDYDECLKALAAYNLITNSESFMNLTQQVRTDVKSSQLNKKVAQQVAEGESQTAMFDASIESDKHMKQIEGEKAAAYAAAVAALTAAYQMIPNEKDALKACVRSNANNPEQGVVHVNQESCKKVVAAHHGDILANQGNKAALFEAITKFVAKGIEAGIKMNQYDTKAKAVAKAKASIEEEGEDMMVELCQFNPLDPACIQAGERVSNGGLTQGEFSLGNDNGNNAFNMNPATGSEFGEAGAATNLDDKNAVAGINSPFADDAKVASDILNPAAAAQTQASGGAQGGGGGMGGGGMGGGSASLGGDLQGAEKEGEKEAEIKAGKVSGMYSASGGGGYKGVSRGSDDKGNPFSSLFDQKGSAGGVETDRSIASGDIDGKASGLFQKISKRYSQIQADKRVEAKNLE